MYLLNLFPLLYLLTYVRSEQHNKNFPQLTGNGIRADSNRLYCQFIKSWENNMLGLKQGLFAKLILNVLPAIYLNYTIQRKITQK